MSDCCDCGLCTERNNVVNGDGSKSAKVVFVGEAPGEQEDAKGKPFVGRAGKYLDSVLKKQGIERRSVFITNIVRCRPPHNRAPTADEVKACLPHLEEELKKIKPVVVVALGSTALSAIAGDDAKLSEMIGKDVDAELGGTRFKLLACYHPSAAMRNRLMGMKFEEVVARAKSFM